MAEKIWMLAKELGVAREREVKAYVNLLEQMEEMDINEKTRMGCKIVLNEDNFFQCDGYGWLFE